MNLKYFKRCFEIFIKLSIFKTFYINYNYFGIKGLWVLPILVGKNTEFKLLKGKIIISNFQTGVVHIGLNDIGIFSKKSTVCTFQNSGTIEFKGKCRLGQGTKISNTSYISFGNNVNITGNSAIISHKAVEIGDDTLISWGVLIMDTDFHKILNSNGDVINEPNVIKIGNHCWLCSDCKILKGSVISDNSIVAANSIITEQFDKQNVLLINNKIVKENIYWKP